MCNWASVDMVGLQEGGMLGKYSATDSLLDNDNSSTAS